jgi:lysophospholipase L1-like esterase
MTGHFKRAGPLVLVAVAALALAVAGRAAWRIGQAVELARQSEPFQQSPDRPTVRLLIVGDSTAVGTGASVAAASVAGLLARDHPRLAIVNRGRDGARCADLDTQLGGSERFDVVLVLCGGNDVIRMRPMDAVAEDVDRIAALAARLAPTVVLMPAGNVGNAPFFFAPVSWLMTARSRALHRAVHDAALRHGALYVDLFEERDADPFARRADLSARDGLHPSDAGYLLWVQALTKQAGLAQRLAPALPAPRP